jgi:tRNA 2-thiocytidine biosynthesis protein TtcA
LLSLLSVLKSRSPVYFNFFAYTLDQGQPDFNKAQLEEYFQKLEVEYIFGSYDTYSVLQQKLDPGQTQCFLCSRIRRGIMYTDAVKFGATKIALGHHADDAAETLLMNLFYSGRLAAISPKLVSDDGRNTVIRPLIEVSESEIISYCDHMKLPVIPCSVCGSQEKLQRQRIKKMIGSEELNNPQIRSSIKSALKNVQTRHLWELPDPEIEELLENVNF